MSVPHILLTTQVHGSWCTGSSRNQRPSLPPALGSRALKAPARSSSLNSPATPTRRGAGLHRAEPNQRPGLLYQLLAAWPIAAADPLAPNCGPRRADSARAAGYGKDRTS